MHTCLGCGVQGGAPRGGANAMLQAMAAQQEAARRAQAVAQLQAALGNNARGEPSVVL